MPPDVLQRRIKVTLTAFWALFAILLWVNYQMCAPYLLAVSLGAILSLLLRRLYDATVRSSDRPKASALLVTIAATLLVIIPFLIVCILSVEQGIEIAKTIAQQPDFSVEGFSNKLAHWKIARTFIGGATAIQAKFRELLNQVSAFAPGVVFKIFGGLPELILQTALAIASCYFFLVDGQRFVGWLRDKLPLDAEVRSSVFRSFSETAVSAILSTVTAATVQAIIITSGFLLLGAPAPFLAAGTTFIAAWLPLVGSTPVWGSAAVYFFVQGSTYKGFAMIGCGMLTGVSDNIVYPLVLQGRAQLHPLVSLVAVFGGIQMFGIFGVFIGPIVAALLIAVANSWPVIAEKIGVTRGPQLVPPT